MDEKQNVINNIVVALLKEFPELDSQRICSVLYIELNEYSLEKEERELIVYEGDPNDVLIKRFLVVKRVNGLTSRTLRYYEETLRFINGRIRKPFQNVTPDDVRIYLAFREINDNTKATTRDNERRVLSSFFDWANDEGIVKFNPVKKVPKIKGEKKQKHAFSDTEIELIRNSCKTAREKAIVETLLSTGCRASELVGMKIKELNANKIVVHGKGRKDRTCYLNAKAMIAIDVYLKERKDDNPYIFCGGFFGVGQNHSRAKDWYKYPELVSDKPMCTGTVESTVRSIGRRAGVENCHPHRFRRTCATLALRRGMPIEQVSKMLGHEQLDTTKIYLDLNERDLELAHEKYVY